MIKNLVSELIIVQLRISKARLGLIQDLIQTQLVQFKCDQLILNQYSTLIEQFIKHTLSRYGTSPLDLLDNS